MDEGQNLNNGGSGLGAAGGFDAFQNNNTFQDVGAGMGGGMGVPGSIVSSSDDVVLNGGGDDSGQKSRKRLLLGVAAVVVVFALVAVGVFVMWKGGVFSGKEENSKPALSTSAIDLHKVIDSEWQNILRLTSFAEYAYSGNVSLMDFIVDDNNDLIVSLKNGLGGMQKIKKRLDDGPVVSGLISGIDLELNYTNLRKVLDDEYEKYAKFVDITEAIMHVVRNDNTVIDNAYGGAFQAFAAQVVSYYSAMKSLASDYSSNGCPNDGLEICDAIQGEIVGLQSQNMGDGENIAQIYLENVGQLNFENESSMMFYMANLYVATEGGNV